MAERRVAIKLLGEAKEANKGGWFKTKKVENPNYVKATIPKYVESWECKFCFDIDVKASS